jgi:hypothetical protein
LFLFFVILATPPAQGQLYVVYFKDPKHAKRFKGKTSLIGGEQVLIGEGKEGIRPSEDGASTLFTSGSKALNELYVADPRDPTAVPYEIEEGKRKVTNRKQVAAIAGDMIGRVIFFDRRQTLLGLAMEYRYRQDKIDEWEAKRDEFKKATREWFDANSHLLNAYDRLHAWLINTCFHELAKKMERTISKEKKGLEEAAKERLQTAMDSIQEGSISRKLKEAADEITGGKLKYSVQESQHFRFYYFQSLSDTRVHNLLELAERILDGFRVAFVDPWVGPDYKDYLPDSLMIEFFLAPEDISHYEQFWVKYYGKKWDEATKERRLKLAGSASWEGSGPHQIAYYKYRDHTDWEGRVAHSMGHALNAFHFDRARGGADQHWIQEGLAYYIGLEYLGRNSTICIGFSKGRYESAPSAEGLKTIQRGARPGLLDLAVQKGPALDSLCIKEAHEFDDADLAKAWSLFDYLAREEGKNGQLLLRASFDARKTNNRGKYLQRFRDKSRKLLELEEAADPLGEINQRWEKSANTEIGRASRTR